MNGSKPKEAVFNRHVGRLPPVLIGAVATVAMVPSEIQRELSFGRLNRYELAPITKQDESIDEIDSSSMQRSKSSEVVSMSGKEQLGVSILHNRQSKNGFDVPLSPSRPNDRLQPIRKEKGAADSDGSALPVYSQPAFRQPQSSSKTLGSTLNPRIGIVAEARMSSKIAPLPSASLAEARIKAKPAPLGLPPASQSAKADSLQRPPHLDRHLSFIGLVGDYDSDRAPTAAASGLDCCLIVVCVFGGFY